MKQFHNNKTQLINMSLYNKISAVDMAEVLKVKKLDRSFFELYLNNLTKLEVTVAKMLVKSHFDMIELRSLRTISNEALNHLAKVKGGLALGLRSLNVEQANILLEHSAALELSGLKMITVAVARVLSQYKGNVLDLPQIDSIHPDAFKCLSEFKGEFLTIGNLIQKK